MLNAASTDSNFPADDIPASYLSIININTASMTQPLRRGVLTSLYVGDLKWNNHTTPHNLFPFTLFELDPLSAMQSEQCMQLHILSKSTKGKLLKGIKASQIQEVKVHRLFKELHQVLSFYSGITSILFGTGNALVVGVISFTSAILTKKIIYKGRIAADGNLPTKILYAMEIQIQR